MTREEAKAVVEKLVNRFAEQRNGYHAADYNETKTRREFIDPLFTAFGWDMDNKDDVAEPYREVIHEDKVKIQGKTKAPDYGFRLSGSKDRLFFVEAKKPSVPLKANKESAFQVRRYGWNSGVSLSILTNFEEFSIYDCSKKPGATESSTAARLKYFTYEQLLQEFDFFYDIFSREAVVKGRFDNYIKSDTAKKGTQTPDKEFVVSLDKWRKFIAIDIAKSNLKLTEDELNFAVQLIIDRLIFLRFCEDRGVETYGQLKAAVSKGDAYKNLCGVFKDADNKYNSGLFDFKKDRITQELKVTNKIIKGIVEDLYSPNCEYDFKALPVEVLGNAYEQFLGKVIRIDKAHHAVIEEKPEVRKAGGVYYTPEYIVDYIVENTVGKLIAGKTPKEIEKIKIVDPACGSGSFLLGAFQYLLNFHAEYYHKNGYATKKTKDNPLTPHGTLSTAEKKKILLNNIYGVDIDANAVEVTKLSLLLKCMEGETDASIKQQFNMFHERVLPDLDNNIKDGNSLVDTDFYDEQIELGYEKKIKPFSWKKSFPSVFKQGGFDVVIGNPPYGATISKEQLQYILKKYPVIYKFPDTYCVFMVKAQKLLKENGLMGYIVPNTFCDLENCDDFRKWFLAKITPKYFFQTGWAFKDAVVDTLVFIALNKGSVDDDNLSIVINESFFKRTLKEFLENNLFKIDYRNSKEDLLILNKLKKYKPLSTLAEIKAGVKMYEKGKGIPPQTEKIIKERPYSQEGKKPNGWYPLYRGADINRYSLADAKEFVNYGPWLAAPRSKELFKGPKILMRRTDDVLRSILDISESICVNSCHVIKLMPSCKEGLDEKYLLALLNSKLFQKIFELQNPQMIGKVFSEIKVIYVERFPIKVIDNSNSGEKNALKEIIKHVDFLINSYKEIKEIKLQTKIDQLKQRIEHSEEKINHLVYELYELTPEEIKLVEEANS